MHVREIVNEAVAWPETRMTFKDLKVGDIFVARSGGKDRMFVKIEPKSKQGSPSIAFPADEILPGKSYMVNAIQVLLDTNQKPLRTKRSTTFSPSTRVYRQDFEKKRTTQS